MPAQDLKRLANELRVEVLKMVSLAGAGHVAGPLSSADIFAALYLGGSANVNSSDPWNRERDRIVLSCGHYCPILYAALAYSGYFPRQELSSFGQMGSLLGIHPERRVGQETLAGIEVSSGPLGQGVSVAVGMALALKLEYGERAQKDTPKVFCILSDGELQEGQVWEAFQFAVRRQLDNLIFILDSNRVQIDHFVSEVVTGHVVGKLESFGLEVYETDGNKVEEVQRILERAKMVHGAPAMIVAHTVAGKGVGFMEDDPKWHDKVPNYDELRQAIMELENE